MTGALPEPSGSKDCSHSRRKGKDSVGRGKHHQTAELWNDRHWNRMTRQPSLTGSPHLCWVSRCLFYFQKYHILKIRGLPLLVEEPQSSWVPLRLKWEWGRKGWLVGTEANLRGWRSSGGGSVVSMEGTFGKAGIKREGSGDTGWHLDQVSLQEELSLQALPGPG